MWDLRDPSIRHTRLVRGTIFSHKGQGSAVNFASFILIVSKVTLCNLAMADQITLTHKSQTNIYMSHNYFYKSKTCQFHTQFHWNIIGNENLEKTNYVFMWILETLQSVMHVLWNQNMTHCKWDYFHQRLYDQGWSEVHQSLANCNSTKTLLHGNFYLLPRFHFYLFIIYKS